MQNAGDGDVVFAHLLEEDAIVAATEAEARHGRLELLHITIAGGDIAVYAVENIESGLAINGAKVGAGIKRPIDGQSRRSRLLAHRTNSRRTSSWETLSPQSS